MNAVIKAVTKDKSVWLYILLIFCVTRIILGIIGYITLQYLPAQQYQNWRAPLMTEHPLMGNWAVWDSQWYLQIAEHGYADAIVKSSPALPSSVAPSLVSSSPASLNETKYSTIGFFPLYPFVVAIVELFVRDYLLAGILVSNIFLIVGAYLLYKLIRLDHDEATARRGILYLFLVPAAYIFSAVYPESMLLTAWIACVYFARTDRWLFAGIAGFLAALIHPTGFFIVIPAAWIYMQKRGFSLKKIRWNVVSVGLIPLGLLAWGFANYLMTGDLLAYSHVQQGAWGHHFTFPFVTIWQSFQYSIDYVLNAVFTLVAFIAVCFGYKKIPAAYWIFALCVILFNPTTGTIIGSLRYFAPLFPITILLAVWSKNEKANQAMIVSLALLQGFLFVFWTLGFWFVS